MLDWAGRIEDLCDHLAREHGVDDKLAVEVLLSALVPCPRTRSPWLILETNWYSRNCYGGWFSFGETWLPRSLAQIRARSPWREIEAETKEWLEDEKAERLFIEPDWERYPRFHRLTQAQFLLQRALRVRTKRNRGDHTIRTLDEQERDRRTDELAALTRAVLEDRIGSRPQNPPAFRQPPNFLYHLELLQRLAPWYTDWDTLVALFAQLAIRRAYLYGRTETNDEDNLAMARVARDSVPPWIQKAVRQLSSGPSKASTLENSMTLEEWTRRSGQGAHRELVRLRRNGLIEWSAKKMHWRLLDEHHQGVVDLIDGYPFGRERPRVALASTGH